MSCYTEKVENYDLHAYKTYKYMSSLIAFAPKNAKMQSSVYILI